MSKNTKSPIRVMFLVTSLPVGGAETLLVNLVRRLDRDRFEPEIACLKELDKLGEVLINEMPVHSRLLSSKFDLRVLPRMIRLLRDRKIDAVVTVGAGDKMFWGRLAARLAGVPVILSALHSTGWPDSVGRLNRLLTPITDGFIGVAKAHAEHLVAHEKFPQDKVFTIYNGVDTERFAPQRSNALRKELNIAADAPVVGILAALRPEKNHELFLNGAQRIRQEFPNAQYVVIGDGERREALQSLAAELSIADAVHFLGSRADVAEILPDLDVVALTSHNEASPVSILEALSCGVPVVSARVGSVSERVSPGETGELFDAGDLDGYVTSTIGLLRDFKLRQQLGRQGREHVVKHASLDAMVSGYENLISQRYQAKLSVNPPLESDRLAENSANFSTSATHSGV